MRNLLWRSLSLAFILANVTAGMAETRRLEEEATSDPKIRVLVYNMANVPSPVLAQAENEASRIFNEARIYPLWVECPCDNGLSSTDLMLRIIPKLFGTTRAKVSNDALGYAPVSTEGGVLATVFFNRVEAVTKGGPVAPVLGNAMAHELGHLLLGQNAHSSEGIMRAYWNRDSLKLAQRGLLNFSTEQSQLIRAHVPASSSQR